MTIAFFSVPTPQHYHHKVQLYKPKNSWPATTYPCFSKILVPPSSTPTSLISSSSDEEELEAPNQPEFSIKQRYHTIHFSILKLFTYYQLITKNLLYNFSNQINKLLYGVFFCHLEKR
jgi:hypothetical protein